VPTAIARCGAHGKQVADGKLTGRHRHGGLAATEQLRSVPHSQGPLLVAHHEQERLPGREGRIGGRGGPGRLAQGTHAGQSRIEHGAIEAVAHFEQDVLAARRHAQQAATTVARTHSLGNKIKLNKAPQQACHLRL